MSLPGLFLNGVNMLITSGDLFKAALRKCGGVIAEGETPSNELMEDTRMAFNILLDSWSAERLSVFTTQDQTFTWPAGEVSRTLGPTGDFVGLRPVRIDESSYFKDTSVDIDYNLEIISESDYNAIGLKSSTSPYPQYMNVGTEVPDITIYLWPVPTIDLEFHFISPLELVQVDDLVTDIIVPQGYYRALIFNLAVEICVELGLDAPKSVRQTATSSKRGIKANNAPKDILKIPEMLLGKGRKFNIFTGI